MADRVPTLPAPPPILLAGFSVKMLELAGEIADGVVLWLCAPEYIRSKAFPAIRRGRARAGKPFEGFEVVAAVPAALTADASAAGLLFKGELTRYLALPFYRAMLAPSGFGPEIERLRSRAASRMQCRTGSLPRWARSADSRRWRTFVAAHREAGVTLPAIRHRLPRRRATIYRRSKRAQPAEFLGGWLRPPSEASPEPGCAGKAGARSGTSKALRLARS